MSVSQKPARISHEGRVVLLAFLAGLPGSATAMWMLWTGNSSTKVEWTLTVLIVGAWLGLALAVRERVVFPLQTLSNLLGALREGDFSVRGRSPRPDDALGEVMREVNTLGSTLREQRLGAMEATTLLRTVMREIAVAIFAFDEHRRLRLVNRAGERLLAGPAERLLGQTASDLQMDACLDGPPVTTLQTSFPGGAGRWGVRRTRIREHGLPLELVVISDLTQALSEQELHAWQRLVRVLGHELNNSLAPVKSIAGSLEAIISRESLPDDWRDDMRRGLRVITSRSESLSRFIGAYARLAKLPRPQLQPLSVADLRGARGQLRNPHPGSGGARPRFHGAGRPRSVGAGADQSAAQRRRCLAHYPGRGPRGLAARCRHDGDLDQGRGARTFQHGESVRPVFHYQAGRFGHRAGVEPADRRRPWRRAVAGEPDRWAGLHRPPAPAGVKSDCRPLNRLFPDSSLARY